jgi:peptidyl-prolyl cis-trans isomerase SurA
MGNWNAGVRREMATYYLVAIRDVLAPATKELSEVKGTVISDYQNYLEKAWITGLKRNI